MTQTYFIKHDYDRTVQPFWNEQCHKISQSLFLPYTENNIPNFKIHYLSSLIRKLTPVHSYHFPLSFKFYVISSPDIVVKAVKKVRFYFTSTEQRLKYEQMMMVARRAYNLAVDMCNNREFIDEQGKPVDIRIPIRDKVKEESAENNHVFDTNVCDQAVRIAKSEFITLCKNNKKKKNTTSFTSFSRLGFKSRKDKNRPFPIPGWEKRVPSV